MALINEDQVMKALDFALDHNAGVDQVLQPQVILVFVESVDAGINGDFTVDERGWSYRLSR